MKIFLLNLLLTVVFVPCANAQEVTLISDSAIMSYKNGVENDISVILTKAALEKAGISYDYKIQAWPRLYQTALDEENILLPLLARTPEREPLFKWVARTIHLRFYFYRLKSREDIAIKSLEDIMKYRVGVMKDDVRHQYLEKKGFKNQLEVFSDVNQGFQMLLAGRFDLYPSSKLEMDLQCEKEQFKPQCAKITSDFELKEISSWIYSAYSKSTSDEIVNKTKDGFDLLKTDGTYHDLLEKYSK